MKPSKVKIFSALTLALILCLPLFSCGNNKKGEKKEDMNTYSSEKLFDIIPAPKEVALEGDADNYVVYPLKKAISSTDSEFEKYIAPFNKYLAKINNTVLRKEEGGIVLTRDKSLSAGEYKIECRAEGVTVSASDDDGITYALATLHQIIRSEKGELSVPSYTIKDKPDSSYRALMVDLARQWHPYETLRDYIDICYIYKIKFLHLHFTDNESYTLPSEAFPRLSTEGRSYTKEQIKELNEYALARNIELIPEVDIPGHAVGLTNAYPELFSNKDADGNYVDATIICAGKAGLIDNLQTLYSEVISMFPNSRYIHIGGDEANISTWESCPDCIAYMNENGISGKYPLYTRVIKNITDMILSLDKTPIVWEGFPKEGAEEISRDIIVTAWESLYHLPNDLIEEGFTITNSSWKPLYIVPPTHFGVPGGRWYPSDILDWNIYTWMNWWDQSAAYEKPIVIEPTDQVIGGTLCAWENDYETDIVRIKENLGALSERLWNVNGKVSKDSFEESLDRMITFIDRVIK